MGWPSLPILFQAGDFAAGWATSIRESPIGVSNDDLLKQGCYRLLQKSSGRLEVFRKLFAITLVGTFAAVAAGASANPGTYDTAFEFSGNGGPINDFSVEWFSAQPSSGTVNPAYANLTPNPANAANFPINGASLGPNIILELQITGLQHTSPSDLNIFLLDPFGTGIEIMDDRGDSNDFNGTLFFRDPSQAKPLPMDPAPLVDGSVYGPEAVGTGGKDPNSYFAGYQTTGNDEWRLVIIDDSVGDQGTFRSFTIRGLVVPEPATLSLLGIGGIVLLRRRKKA